MDRPPNRAIELWESLGRRTQAVIALPTACVALFLVNLGPFNQPLWRSILYGLFEGGLLGGFVLWVTAQEQASRESAREPSPEQEQGHALDPGTGERGPDRDPGDLARDPRRAARGPRPPLR